VEFFGVSSNIFSAKVLRSTQFLQLFCASQFRTDSRSFYYHFAFWYIHRNFSNMEESSAILPQGKTNLHFGCVSVLHNIKFSISATYSKGPAFEFLLGDFFCAIFPGLNVWTVPQNRTLYSSKYYSFLWKI
jgi:hypothetical protein